MIETGLLEVARSPALLSTAACLLLAFILRLVLGQSQKLKIPVSTLKDGNVTKSIMDGRDQYPDEPFVLPTKQPWVILPHSMVNEVKSLPADKVSFMALNYVRMQGKYTGIGAEQHPEGIAAIRNDLTRNISKVLSDLQDEISYTFDKEIGKAPTWKEKNVYSTVLQVVAHLSARTFVGLPLCRDKEWIEATINITTDTVACVNAVTKLHPFVRPIMAPFIPEVRRIKEYNKFFATKMKPQVDAIIAAHKTKVAQGESIKAKLTTEDIMNDEVTGENHNLVNWIINNYTDINRVTAKDIGLVEVGAAFAAIHTTSMAISHAIFDLAANPKYADELRKEIEGVIEEENQPDKQLKKTSMPKLKKLDSFIKESQRMNPPGAIAIGRLITAKEGVTLSNGSKLPYGTSIGFGNPFFTTSTVPSNTIITSKTQPPLSEFYPWRYSELRSSPGLENKHQFVTVDGNDITFGSGVHACPGRFFASNEIKVVLVELLKSYDVALGPKGQSAGVDGFTKPKLMEFDAFYFPDPYAKIWLKDRV